jgi:hypothetical protein
MTTLIVAGSPGCLEREGRSRVPPLGAVIEINGYKVVNYHAATEASRGINGAA